MCALVSPRINLARVVAIGVHSKLAQDAMEGACLRDHSLVHGNEWKHVFRVIVLLSDELVNLGAPDQSLFLLRVKGK